MHQRPRLLPHAASLLRGTSRRHAIACRLQSRVTRVAANAVRWAVVQAAVGEAHVLPAAREGGAAPVPAVPRTRPQLRPLRRMPLLAVGRTKRFAFKTKEALPAIHSGFSGKNHSCVT